MYPAPVKVFQFQYGAIKGKFGTGKQIVGVCFNSSMVRLKDAGRGSALSSAGKFQFQYGAIKGANSRV